jgi:glycogen debranching enzyme
MSPYHPCPVLPYPNLIYITSSLSRSVAVVAWELFTGECPYEGMTHIEVRYAALTPHACH